MIPHFPNLFTAASRAQSVANFYSGRLIWVCDEVVSRMKEELSSKLCTQMHEKDEDLVPQHLDGLLPVKLDFKI